MLLCEPRSTYCFPCCSIKISLHTIFFFLQSLLSFLEVLANTILREESFRLGLVISFSSCDERGLEMLLVNIKCSFVAIGVIKTEGN